MRNWIPLVLEVLDPSQTTGLRAQGKIFVVVWVVGLIFLGIIIYLVSMDLRLRKLESKDKT